jgi:hypothetical protein
MVKAAGIMSRLVVKTESELDEHSGSYCDARGSCSVQPYRAVCLSRRPRHPEPRLPQLTHRPRLLKVTNSRKADPLQLQAAEVGSVNLKKVLGGVKSGKQALAKLPQVSDCHVDLGGTFSDGQSMDASGSTFARTRRSM